MTLTATPRVFSALGSSIVPTGVKYLIASKSGDVATISDVPRVEISYERLTVQQLNQLTMKPCVGAPCYWATVEVFDGS